MILPAVVTLFASGYSPPGICGEVLRHNQSLDIDASPLLDSEVENMAQLEEELARLQKECRQHRDPLDDTR